MKYLKHMTRVVIFFSQNLSEKIMNNFCNCLESSLNKKFKVQAEVYVSKKKELVHISLLSPLISYSFFLMKWSRLLKSTGTRGTFFIQRITIFFQDIMTALSGDTTTFFQQRTSEKVKNVGPFRQAFRNFRTTNASKFSQNLVKVLEINGSFYVLIRKRRAKILIKELDNLFRGVRFIFKKSI